MLLIGLALTMLPAEPAPLPTLLAFPQEESVADAPEGTPQDPPAGPPQGPPYGAPAGGSPGRPPIPPWSVGVGAVVATRPYFGGETRIQAIPVIRYQGERFTFEGPFARYRLGEWRDVTFDALARYRFDGYDEDDGDVLDGMERDDTVDLGVRATIPLGRGADLRVEALGDVLGRHEGFEVGASVGRTFRTGKLFIVPTVGVRWQSANLADYYFGVRPEEARPGRPAFEVGSVAGFDIAIAARYMISKRTTFAFVVRETILGEEIGDSPIIDRPAVTSAVFSLTYSL